MSGVGEVATERPLAFAFDSPPLVTPQPVFLQPHYAVRLCIDEPMIGLPDTGRLAALCFAADTLIERVHKVPKSAAQFDVSILQEIEALCHQVAPKKHAQTTMQDLGLLDLFPYLAMGLSGDKLDTVQNNPGAAYFHYVSLLNQVVMMGTQLYHDACMPQHHKYAAHQIALLYQCLNMLQGDTRPIRRVVEARFDEIKAITESREPYLPVELSAWIQEVTWLCREEIQVCPAYVHKRLDAILRAARGEGGPGGSGSGG
ncbi:hypothetical protein PLESTB_000068500 [Pleodorina starrii]|uniref:Uncharacterized protein n=1 Tax=Pleodorina starrii TaxID=330485 RepID=A0A9W6BAF8_9CHLO|nr:hypothetical protein PLESTM_001604800 [Pleodorina starrii]GLC48185.1 hypothetical protein PLESTB_000068500 [Pleodorina starrii]GLC67431.1 hypothetical protein PLESTF_000555500 [Pleodorina starrii]